MRRSWPDSVPGGRASGGQSFSFFLLRCQPTLVVVSLWFLRSGLVVVLLLTEEFEGSSSCVREWQQRTLHLSVGPGVSGTGVPETESDYSQPRVSECVRAFVCVFPLSQPAVEFETPKKKVRQEAAKEDTSVEHFVCRGLPRCKIIMSSGFCCCSPPPS